MVRSGFRREQGLALLVIAAAVLLALILVYRRAWVSDDGLITLRYVQNTLEGLGPVFNAGERVQGYTHPLWFFLLVAGGLVVPSLYAVPILLGLALTAALVAVLGSTLRDHAVDGRWAALLLWIALLVLVSSGSWRTFQTGGLENSLTHFLLLLWIAELLGRRPLRPAVLVLLGSLVCLSRPDQLFLVAPTTAWAFWHVRSGPIAARTGVALVPSVAWMMFAWAYYGSPLPNTAVAKLGVYPSRLSAIGQGFTYGLDWLFFEPLAVLATIVASGLILAWDRTARGRLLVLGLVSQAAWVVWIGGDFMRGRFFLSVFTAAVIGAALAAARASRRRPSILYAVLALTAVTAGITAQETLGPESARGGNTLGISDEWRYYRPYHLSSVVQAGQLEGLGEKRDLAAALRLFIDQCGPVAMHEMTPAYLGYQVGSDLTLIDVLGLTDAYIAHLPDDLLVDERPRPGHPVKRIPLEYLWSRGDIRLVEGWEQALLAGDCSLREQAREGTPPRGYLVPRLLLGVP